MATEPAEPNDWCVLDTYADRLAAEADAGYLRSEMVAAKVEAIGDFFGQFPTARLWVDATLTHRARWLLKLNTVSEAELEYLATGKLPNPRDDDGK
jgi:hypothetical protein